MQVMIEENSVEEEIDDVGEQPSNEIIECAQSGLTLSSTVLPAYRNIEEELDQLEERVQESDLPSLLPIAANRSFLRYYVKAQPTVEDAFNQLSNYVNWRVTHNIGDLTYDVVREQLELGKLCVLPNEGDKSSDVLVVFVSRLHYPRDFPTLTFLRSLVYLIELYMCDGKDHTGFIVLNDMRNVGRANFDFKVSHVVRELQTCLPILPSKVLIYKPPFIFKLVWRLVHPFLTPSVINLLKIVHSEEELRAIVRPENLLQDYGGKLDPTNVNWLHSLPGVCCSVLPEI